MSWESWDSISVHPNALRTRPAYEAQTGYCRETLDELWEGAAETFMLVEEKSSAGRRSRFKQRSKETWRAQHYFYVLLVYIHCYPVEDSMPDVLTTSRLNSSVKGGVNANFLYRTIMPIARIWSGRINHIFWGDRLAFNNHHVSNFLPSMNIFSITSFAPSLSFHCGIL